MNWLDGTGNDALSGMSGVNFKFVISEMSSKAGSCELPDMTDEEKMYGLSTH